MSSNFNTSATCMSWMMFVYFRASWSISQRLIMNKPDRFLYIVIYIVIYTRDLCHLCPLEYVIEDMKPKYIVQILYLHVRFYTQPQTLKFISISPISLMSPLE